MSVKMYPPGGGDPIIPHPTKIADYESKGWTFEPKKPAKPVKPKEE